MNPLACFLIFLFSLQLLDFMLYSIALLTGHARNQVTGQNHNGDGSAAGQDSSLFQKPGDKNLHMLVAKSLYRGVYMIEKGKFTGGRVQANGALLEVDQDKGLKSAAARRGLSGEEGGNTNEGGSGSETGWDEVVKHFSDTIDDNAASGSNVNNDDTGFGSTWINSPDEGSVLGTLAGEVARRLDELFAEQLPNIRKLVAAVRGTDEADDDIDDDIPIWETGSDDNTNSISPSNSNSIRSNNDGNASSTQELSDLANFDDALIGRFLEAQSSETSEQKRRGRFRLEARYVRSLTKDMYTVDVRMLFFPENGERKKNSIVILMVLLPTLD
jgi:hypothetical protein